MNIHDLIALSHIFVFVAKLKTLLWILGLYRILVARYAINLFKILSVDITACFFATQVIFVKHNFL